MLATGLPTVLQSESRSLREYRDGTAEQHRQNLGAELMDVIWFVTQLACSYDVDLEAQAQAMVDRAESRALNAFRPQLLAGVEALKADASRAQSCLILS